MIRFSGIQIEGGWSPSLLKHEMEIRPIILYFKIFLINDVILFPYIDLDFKLIPSAINYNIKFDNFNSFIIFLHLEHFHPACFFIFYFFLKKNPYLGMDG